MSKTTDLALRIEVVEPRGSFGDVYAHVLVRFGVWDNERSEFTGMYGDDAQYEHIGFACQLGGLSGDLKDRTDSYGWTLGITDGNDQHPLALWDVEKAVKTMRKLQKAYQDVQNIAGAPQTFGQFVAYYTSKLKPDYFVRGDRKDYLRNEHANLASAIDNRVRDLAGKIKDRRSA